MDTNDCATRGETSDALDSLTERVRSYAESVLTKERYEHSLRVAETAEKLAERHGADEKRAYFAGVAHDICKGADDVELVRLARRDGGEITPLEQSRPSLLHGRAAAVVLRDDFGITDAEILEAVACHTFGKAGMCALAKIIFCADKIEPGRPQMSADYFNKLLALDLDALVKAVLDDSIAYLEKKGRPVAPATLALLKSLEQN